MRARPPGFVRGGKSRFTRVPRRTTRVREHYVVDDVRISRFFRYRVRFYERTWNRFRDTVNNP